jgi:membrane peptidoglycan carboxypeptidase
MRGPVGDGAQAGDPLVPLRGLGTGAWPGAPGAAGAAAGRPAPAAPRHRIRRLVRRAAGVTAALAVLGAMVFGGILAVTPSAGDAQALASASARAHHAAYPGPAVAPRFAASLVATEDHRFYSEPLGIDPFAVARVSWSYLTGGGDQGGATLYQQLAKMLYTPGRSGVAVKVEQVALAVKLDLSYSKRQILQMYAAVVYFGNGYYGLEAASCGYFGVPPARMSWPQAALLAGLVQAPTADDPLRYPARARARELHVIGRLIATGKLTSTRAGAALSVPLARLIANAGRGCSA